MSMAKKWMAALGAGLLSACAGPSTPDVSTQRLGVERPVRAVQMPAIGVISYWEVPDYKELPAGGLALINPQDGVVDATAAQVAQYRPVVRDAAARGVRLLAYVPTGYGVRKPGQPNSGGTTGQSLAMIRRQIDTYIRAYGAANLYGVFFDEADEPCAQAVRDYAELGRYVHARGLKVAVWNPGWPGDGSCFVRAAQKGDVVATFESDLKTYLTDKDLPTDLAQAGVVARRRGVQTWHLIHSAVGQAALKTALDALRQRQPDYAYVTDLRDWTTGDNTWGKPPRYWEAEVTCLVNGVCP
jgi:Spherulation-specific family 4